MNSLDNVPTFKPVICKQSRKLAEKFKEETMAMKLDRWEVSHKKSLEVAIKIKDKEATEWEKEVREKRMLNTEGEDAGADGGGEVTRWLWCSRGDLAIG